MRFVIITGMSGAGRSQAIKAMEDLGFFCVDNLPPALIPKFAEICFKSGGGKMDKIALVMDIRGGELLKDLFPALNSIKEAGYSYEILFLESSDEVLVKRYKETRRNHPLAPDRLINGIKEERKILKDIKKKANHIIDTSNLTPRELKEQLHHLFVEGKSFESIIITVTSFGFKYGIPSDVDLVFDVRFIPNPYYVESMRKLTGKHESVKKYVLSINETKVFLEKLEDMLEFLIPCYIKEGKSRLVIGIGCTGGKHRSVAIAEFLFQALLKRQHRVVIDHRDIDRDNRR